MGDFLGLESKHLAVVLSVVCVVFGALLIAEMYAPKNGLNLIPARHQATLKITGNQVEGQEIVTAPNGEKYSGTLAGTYDNGRIEYTITGLKPIDSTTN